MNSLFPNKTSRPAKTTAAKLLRPLWGFVLVLVTLACVATPLTAFACNGQGSSSSSSVIVASKRNGVKKISLISSSSFYKIVNRNSNKMIDISDGSTKVGGLAILFSDQGPSALNQQWQFRKAGRGLFTIINRNSDLALNVPKGSPNEGVQLQQNTLRNSLNQLWRLVPAGNSGFFIIENSKSNLLIDSANQSTDDTAQIVQNSPITGTNQQNQQWKITLVV